MKTKPSKKKPTPTPPAPWAYPTPPHIIGADWIELPVRSPADSAALYCSIGFSPRPTTGRHRAVAIGGTVLLFKRAPQLSGSTTPTGMTLQLPVDNVELKHQQMIQMQLRVTRLKRLSRGDKAFQWHDPDGYTLRFVGPARRHDDETLDG